MYLVVCAYRTHSVWLHQFQLSSPDSGKNCSWMWETMASGVRQIFLFSPQAFSVNWTCSGLLHTSFGELRINLWSLGCFSQLHSPLSSCAQAAREVKAFLPLLLLCLRVNTAGGSFSSAPEFIIPAAPRADSPQRNSWQLIHPENKEEFPSNQLVWQGISECLKERALL